MFSKLLPCGEDIISLESKFCCELQKPEALSASQVQGHYLCFDSGQNLAWRQSWKPTSFCTGTSSTIKTVILQEIEAEDLYRLKQETLGLQAADFVLLASSSSNLRSIYEAEGSLMEIAQATDDTMPCLLIDFSEGQTPTQVRSALVYPHSFNLFILQSRGS